MTTKNSLPVRYVLYSHYPEGDDLKHYPEKKWPVSKDCSSYFTRPVLPSV